MSKIVEIDSREIVPIPRDVFRLLGMKNAQPSDKITMLYERALELYYRLVEPRGILLAVGKQEFQAIYTGEGLNHEEGIVQKIFPRSKYLALWAFTLGEQIGLTIQSLFDEKEYPLASMLDAVASISAERSAEFGTGFFLRQLEDSGAVAKDLISLLYSPGYCGWHISGQKKLFSRLQPEKIGLRLGETYLMVPLKSTTGVLIAGSVTIHQFQPNFAYCRDCISKSCRERIKSLQKQREVAYGNL